MRADLDPLDHRTVLLLFRLGWNTAKIAFTYGMAESAVANMLAEAREAARTRRATDDAAFAAVGGA